MYVVDNSARKATITLTGEEVAVKFPCTYSVFGIKGDSMLLYPKSNMVQGADGVYDTAEGDGSAMMPLYYQTDTVYIKGTGDCVIWAGNSPLDCPFPKSGKGGGGSGSITIYYTTTALTDNATTNPITVNGESVTVNANEFAIYGRKEFVFDGTHWHEFGDLTDTVGRVGYADTNTEGLGYPANGEVFNSESTNSVTARGAHAEGIAAMARGEGSHAESYSVASAQGSHAHGGGGVSSTANFATAMGFHTYAQAPSSTVVGTWNREYNTSQGEIVPNYLFVVGNGSNPMAKSNIVEVDYTSLNVNGSLQMNGVKLPVPYTTMPTITESMLGQIAMYVGTTDANYTQGWFYIASSDGAAEPTYSWVHLPTQNGYSETVLYTNDTPMADPDTITLSSAYTNFDALVILCVDNSTTLHPQKMSFSYLTSQLALNDHIFLAFGYTSNGTSQTIIYQIDTATSLSKNARQGFDFHVYKIIGINYGSNGGAVANPVRSLAKSEEKEKPIEEEEPTDEMR